MAVMLQGPRPAQLLTSVMTAWRYDASLRRRAVALGAVVVLHAIVIRALAASLAYAPAERGTPNMQVTLIKDLAFLDEVRPPELPLEFELPPVLIPAPEVIVTLKTGPGAIEAEVAQPILGPRMDPYRPNALPVLPAKLKGVVRADAVVVLRIQVMKDGAIGDVEIAESSGASPLDVLAVDYARAHWRYLPAMRNGRLIEDWLTVAVSFRSA